MKTANKDFALLLPDIEALGDLIADVQKPSGEIPGFKGGKTDPWDHVEAAMGLAVSGLLERADKAYRWIGENQLEDGSMYSAYANGRPSDKTKDANLCSYIGVGIYHQYLAIQKRTFISEMWPVIEKGIDFALSLQAKEGQIYWAKSPEGNIDKMALVTGNCSVYMSIKCGLEAAELMGIEKPHWQKAMIKIRAALCLKPHLFNKEKSRYAMDWFYPVLCGVLTGPNAVNRIEKYWDKFVVEKHGVRCVADRPWITIAETAELVMALNACGKRDLALEVFGWILDKCFKDKTFWCGYNYPDMAIWPKQKITWTNAAVLMAADALYNITPAGKIFDHHFWERWV